MLKALNKALGYMRSEIAKRIRCVCSQPDSCEGYFYGIQRSYQSILDKIKKEEEGKAMSKKINLLETGNMLLAAQKIVLCCHVN